MDKNGLSWEENDYVKMNICIQINGLKMQQFWTDSLDDPVVIANILRYLGSRLAMPTVQLSPFRFEESKESRCRETSKC